MVYMGITMMFGTWDVELLVEFRGGELGETTVGPIIVGAVLGATVGDDVFVVGVIGELVVGVTGEVVVGAEDSAGDEVDEAGRFAGWDTAWGWWVTL